MSNVMEARKALIARILEGPGCASRDQRRAAFDNARLEVPLSTLAGKVAKHVRDVTDEDVAAAHRAGLSEDQIFEIVVCAAVGQATRQHDSAVAALKVASGRV